MTAARVPLQVFTARLGFRDPDALNITRKSGRDDGLVFAPSEALLWPTLREMKLAAEEIGHASRGLDDFDGRWRMRRAWWGYVMAFRAEMAASYRRDRGPWQRLLARPRVVLQCYCVDPDHCHRTILAAGILPTLGAEYAGELDADIAEALGEAR